MNQWNYVSAKQALEAIEPGNRVFVQGSACTPVYLLEQLALHFKMLSDIEIVAISLYGHIPLFSPEMEDRFRLNSLFVSAAVRDCVNHGPGDYVPIFLSDIPKLFQRDILPIDVALVQVSLPDRHGFCSLGVSVDIARAAVRSAKKVIALVNPAVPRSHGDSMLDARIFDSMVYHESALQQLPAATKSDTIIENIGSRVAELIEDRATLQTGVGAIPDAVLRNLATHKDLGVHTEMFSDGVVDLMKKGVVNNKYKKVHPFKTVAGFAIGSQQLYDYVDDNPAFGFFEIDYVNSGSVIARNKKAVAINSAIEIDITGQVVADSIGTVQYSGVGGQMDFMHGAAMSEGGKPIIAIPSRTGRGVPRIVPFLKPGGAVVTTRAHMHYVVTEYGTAFLFGKNLRQRAKALIEIAHPDDREWLEKSCFERFRHY